MKITEHTDHRESFWGLVPVKTLNKAKQRLRPCLGADCPEFSITMFMDVIGALKMSRIVRNIAVVTSDPRVVSIAEYHELLVVDEIESMGLNPAIELGIEAIRRRRGHRVAIIPSDVPLISGAEIDRVLQNLADQLRDNGKDIVGICAAKNSGGTNLLCVNTSHALTPNYGHDSFSRHLAVADVNGLRPVQLHSVPLSIDIDEQRDLEEFISYCTAHSKFQETETWQFLLQKGYINQVGRRRIG